MNYDKYGKVGKEIDSCTFVGTDTVYVQFTNGKIEGITKTEPEVEVSSKTIIDLDKVSTVLLMGTSQYKIFDENGKYMQNWTVDKTASVEMLEEELNDVKIEFKDLDIAKEYYCIFEVQDSQGNAYSSNPVKITK